MAHKFDYDLIVIGGGSGGVRTARWSAGLGAKVAICEEDRFGGTCVIRGCVPKKFMVYASHFLEEIELMKSYGHEVSGSTFNWGKLKENRDQEIERLSSIYQNLLSKVDVHQGKGTLVNEHSVLVGGKKISAEKILIAVGGKPTRVNIPGIEHGLDSNDFFNLEKQPKRVLVAGGGYIAVEFAGILKGLGSDVSILIRREHILRGFDIDVRKFLQLEMEKKGISFLTDINIEKIEKVKNQYKVFTSDKKSYEVDAVVIAQGRIPYLDDLNLEKVGVELIENRIKVNDHFQTSIPSIYAIGDCSNLSNLTPVATTEGTKLAEHLFNGKEIEMNYDDIPSAVFSSPPIGTVGLTEEEALEKFDSIDVYESSFRMLKFSLTEINERTYVKMIVDGKSQKVLGIHMVGIDSPEIMQGFGVAIKAGASKADFDRTIGIHPTSAEEFVTMRTKRG